MSLWRSPNFLSPNFLSQGSTVLTSLSLWRTPVPSGEVPDGVDLPWRSQSQFARRVRRVEVPSNFGALCTTQESGTRSESQECPGRLRKQLHLGSGWRERWVRTGEIDGRCPHLGASWRIMWRTYDQTEFVGLLDLPRTYTVREFFIVCWGLDYVVVIWLYYFAIIRCYCGKGLKLYDLHSFSVEC